MPQLPKLKLLQRVLDAIQTSGWRYDVLSEKHPFRISMFNDEQRAEILVYIWNTTHGGGRARPKHEYRIQITGVQPPLQIEVGCQTLLLGWAEDWSVFTAYDVRRHLRFSKQSPSIQAPKSCIDAAVSSGFGFHTRSNGEVVVAFIPAFFAGYVQLRGTVHDSTASEVCKLQRIVDEEAEHDVDPTIAVPSSEEIAEMPAKTRTVRQVARDGTFGQRVRRAYDNACCMCGIQFRIVESAHIVPWAKKRYGTTQNGFALCPNHHRAFDAGIIGVARNFRLIVSESRVAQLEKMDLTGGREHLLGSLFTNIRLPRCAVDRPADEFLRNALQLREWPREFWA